MSAVNLIDVTKITNAIDKTRIQIFIMHFVILDNIYFIVQYVPKSFYYYIVHLYFFMLKIV